MLLQKEIIIQHAKQLGSLSLQIRTETQALKRLRDKVNQCENEQDGQQKRLGKMKRLLVRKKEVISRKVQNYCQKMQHLDSDSVKLREPTKKRSLFQWLVNAFS